MHLQHEPHLERSRFESFPLSRLVLAGTSSQSFWWTLWCWCCCSATGCLFTGSIRWSNIGHRLHLEYRPCHPWSMVRLLCMCGKSNSCTRPSECTWKYCNRDTILLAVAYDEWKLKTTAWGPLGGGFALKHHRFQINLLRSGPTDKLIQLDVSLYFWGALIMGSFSIVEAVALS